MLNRSLITVATVAIFALPCMAEMETEILPSCPTLLNFVATTPEPRRRTTAAPRRSTWETTAAKTPAKPSEICRQVRSRVQYATDAQPEDEWKSGRKTFEDGKGDCEDIAACVKDLSTAKGIETDIFVLTSPVDRKAHAVTIGEEDGRIWVSSNGSYLVVNSMDDAKEEISREMGWWPDQTEMSKVTPP